MQKYKIIFKQSQRLSIILKSVVILALFATISIPVSAQSNRTVKIIEDRPTIAEAFKSIEQQSGLRFSYDNLFDLSRRIDLPKTQSSLSDIMDKILKGTDRSYTISGDFIIIKLPRPDATPIRQYDASKPVEIAKPEAVRSINIPTISHKLIQETAPVVIPKPMGNYIKVDNLINTPSFAIKTNLLYDATASLALGFEVRTSQKTTIDISGAYRLFDNSSQNRLRHYMIQPEFRIWTCEVFNGHFFGLHGHYAKYNVGGLPNPPFSPTMNEYRFEGWLAGAGISYGYHWILGKRWGLEATIGAGWAYMEYDKFPCQECGQKINRESKNYFGPTKAGILLVYTIK